jgi:hypothetical protein
MGVGNDVGNAAGAAWVARSGVGSGVGAIVGRTVTGVGVSGAAIVWQPINSTTKPHTTKRPSIAHRFCMTQAGELPHGASYKRATL